MKALICSFRLLLVFIGSSLPCRGQSVSGHLRAQVANESQTLWADTPAANWLEAYPIGNGSIGAMIFGGTKTERIQFNESSLSTGTTQNIGSYQPFGDVLIYWGYRKTTDYKRELFLNKAIHRTNYSVGDVRYTHDYFISYPDGVMVMEITANARGAVSGNIVLKDVHGAKTVAADGELSFNGSLENGLQYESILGAKCINGKIVKTDSSLLVNSADTLRIYLTAATSFQVKSGKNFLGPAPHDKLYAKLKSATKAPYSDLLNRHVKDYSALFNRVHFYLGSAPNIPTYRRLLNYSRDQSDPGLEALLFQYGRYLLISSSRRGGLPANLQGIWNADIKPAWYSQYTTNINVQMNYWPAEVTNLSECAAPLFDWIENLAAIQRHTSDSLSKTRVGWVAYSTNNIAGGPSKWRLHRPGSAWLSQHFWEHYAFTGDTQFLAQRAYPLLKELVAYWQGHLVERTDGKLITPDGWSPEHGPGKNEGDKSAYPGASYDQQIVYDLFSNYIDAAKVLKRDNAFRAKAESFREKLLGPQIGKWGQLQEWMEDWDDSTDKHRHNSHLFAVHPGRQISPLTNSDWARAAITSLDARGNVSTGWSTAWRINIRARLWQGNKAHEHIKALINPAKPSLTEGEKSGLYFNLFDAHPPFQIDGNFGYTAGVAEMLLQSQTGEIVLLPALPEAWSNGYIIGLKARGNVTVDLLWKDGKLVQASFVAARSGKYSIRCRSKVKTLDLKKDSPVTLDSSLNLHAIKKNKL